MMRNPKRVFANILYLRDIRGLTRKNKGIGLEIAVSHPDGFVLVLLGANRLNSFADTIYSLSQPFVRPLFGLFNYQTNYGYGRLEYETLIAMLMYVLLGWAIVRLITIGDKGDRV